MDIALHLGVLHTDRDHLVRCLLRNREELALQGIAVPNTVDYRLPLRRLGQYLRNQTIDAATRETLLDGLIQSDSVRRLVLSMPNAMGTPRWAIGKNRFYPSGSTQAAQIARLFPDAGVSLFLAIRDPASFLPALAADRRSGGVAQVLRNSDPMMMRWSDLVMRLTQDVAQATITVWRDEDTPLLWPEILRTVAGCDPATELHGWLAWYGDLVTPAGHDAIRRWFAANPAQDDLHRRKILSAMLTRFARPEVVEAESALPGWDEGYSQTLTRLYEQDCDLIASMPGVTLLEP